MLADIANSIKISVDLQHDEKHKLVANYCDKTVEDLHQKVQNTMDLILASFTEWITRDDQLLEELGRENNLLKDRCDDLEKNIDRVF